MISYILFAIINGIIIGMSRTINAQLSIDIGIFKASFWNHSVGFIFLTVILLIMGEVKLGFVHSIPIFSYLGGFFGVLFVAVNSYVFPRIGAVQTTLLVISGQMLSSILMEYKTWSIRSVSMQLLGIVIIIFGIYLSAISRRQRAG